MPLEKKEELALINNIRETYSRLNKMKSDIRDIECLKNENHAKKPKEIEKAPIAPSEPSMPIKPTAPSRPSFKTNVRAKDCWKTAFGACGGAVAFIGVFGLCVREVFWIFLAIAIAGAVSPFLVWALVILCKRTKERIKILRAHRARVKEYRATLLEYPQKLEHFNELKRCYDDGYRIYKKRFDEWNVRRENYLNELSKCEEIDKKLDAEFEEKKKTEIALYKKENKFDELESNFKKMTYGVIGENYFWNLDEIEAYMRDGRADSIKEAIAVFEDAKYKQDLIDAQSMAMETAEQNKPKWYTVFVKRRTEYGESTKTVEVQANSEAEAINAGMNMVPRSISAKAAKQ